MTKGETSKLLNKIKGYYNSQFFIDSYVIDAWTETMKPYELEDAEEHLKEYLKEYPEIAPKPHTFIRGLLTREEKKKIKDKNYKVQCNSCNKWMSFENYEVHYDRCLSTKYLMNRIFQEKGVKPEYDEIFYLKENTFNELYKKYDKRVI